MQNILAAFVPSHAQYDEPVFLRLLQSWLDNQGLGLSYKLKDSALKARRKVRERTTRR